jgi:transposase
MGFDRRFVSIGTFTPARRPAGDPTSSLPGGNPLGVKDWCTLEGFTRLFPVTVHLLASPQGMDRVWSVPRSLGASALEARRLGRDSLGRSFCRWNVFLGKKRGECVGKTKRGKGTKIMVLADGNGTPLAANIHSASPAEVTLIEPLLDTTVADWGQPDRLIYDKAADSDPLRERLWDERGIELICPHRKNRKRPKTQDGRKLRRYQRRWKIERSIAWLQNFRRLVVRYEHYPHLFGGFVQLACMFTILRRF